MTISILFNWPPSQSSARVSFNGPTVDDLEYEFRAGIIKKDEQDKIYWFKPGWVEAKNLHEIKFDSLIGEKVIIEKRKKNGKDVLMRHIWDIEEKWPENAGGASSVATSWTFH